LTISRGGGRETQNTPNRSVECEDRREAAAGAAPGFPFDYIHTISFSIMMKRE
jgi:hypothetical protein